MKRFIILTLVVLAILGVVILKKSDRTVTPLPKPISGIPRLLDLGSKGCPSCTLLEPVLEELRVKYVGKLQVDFVDVWQHEEVATDYGVDLIPTQIFFDSTGHEFHRHQGFISVEEVETIFAKAGVALDVK